MKTKLLFLITISILSFNEIEGKKLIKITKIDKIEFSDIISFREFVYYSNLDGRGLYLTLNNNGFSPTTAIQYNENEEFVSEMNFKKQNGENTIVLTRLTRIKQSYQRTIVTKIKIVNSDLKNKIINAVKNSDYEYFGTKGKKKLYKNEDSFLYYDEVKTRNGTVYYISIIR